MTKATEKTDEKKLTFKEQLQADLEDCRTHPVPHCLIDMLKRLVEHVVDDKAKE